jgi:4-aminobutyrate aminotransferase-like enzyme
MGELLQAGLRELATRHAIIGDVRGRGLFLGFELVLDRETLTPAPLQAAYLVNRLCELGILTGTDGPHHNVIKIKPPLVIGPADVDCILERIERILGEDPMQPS